MKLLAHVHMAAPVHGAGAEWMLDAVCADLQARQGWDVKIVARDVTAPYTYHGLHVYPQLGTDMDDAYDWADVVLTHLDVTGEAMARAIIARKPVAHLVHNDRQLAHHKVPKNHLAIWNSWWLREQGDRDGVVCHPPVWMNQYRVAANWHDRGPYVTQLNLSTAKGSHTFYDLASRNPGLAFLAVAGAYGTQDVRHPDNVLHWPNQRDVRDVYRQSRIVLMPSLYESFGRVALEAACSGIPTIASPTPGLIECLGDAGTYVRPDDLAGWDAALDCALDRYDCLAAAAYERAQWWQGQHATELDDLAAALTAYARQGYSPSDQGMAAQWRTA